MNSNYINRFFKTAFFSAMILSISSGAVFAANYAFVDVAKVFDEYNKTKDNDSVLKEMGQSKEQERENLVNEIRALKDELVLMNDDAKVAKQEALDKKIRDLQDFDRETKRELGERRSKLVREIFQDIDDVVQRYGEKKGYDMIFNERALLYHNPKLDTTAEILAELNKAYKK